MAAYLIGEMDMITCKEDLIGTYVDGRDIKLGNEYQKLLFKFGVKWLHFDDQEVRAASGMTNHFCFNGEFLSWSQKEPADINYEKKLTLKDLKPKPTKFVKVEGSIFDLKEEFEKGELYSSNCEGHYTQLKYKKSLYLAAHQDSIYRQVEIDWGSELREALELTSHRPLGAGSVRVGDSDLTDDEFIELCHKVAELTDKTE